MENQMQNQEGVRKVWGKYVKILVGIVAVIALVSAVFAGWGVFKQWQVRRGVENFAETLKRLEQEDYRRAMADTYGGKTPQETLQMYIDAVEKGDYELASKYLVEIKGNEEIKKLSDLKNKDNLKLFLNIIKKAELDGNIDENEARMRAVVDEKEGPYYFIRFIKYPNNIWKIKEI